MSAGTRGEEALNCSRSLRALANVGRSMIAEIAWAAASAGDWRLETGDWRLETGDYVAPPPAFDTPQPRCYRSSTLVIKLTSLAVAAVLTLAQAPAFEVASITPTRDTEGIREFQIHPGGRLAIAGMTLKDLVRRAYLASDRPQDEDRIVGGPSWINAERFDILAKAEGDPGFDAEGRPVRLLAMLRTLVESRFRLTVHAESREMQVYDLARDGQSRPGLRPSALDCPVFQQGIPRPTPDPVRWCGFRAELIDNVVRVTAQGVTMAEAATNLAGLRSVARPVRDRTALPGRFDFQFEYAPALTQAVGESATVFTAIRERLGLKLQPSKGPVDFIVVDTAERPNTD